MSYKSYKLYKNSGYKAIAFCAAVTLSSAGALGADLGGGSFEGSGSLKDSPVVTGASFRWTGIYVGAGLGGGATNLDTRVNRTEYEASHLQGDPCTVMAGHPFCGADGRLTQDLLDWVHNTNGQPQAWDASNHTLYTPRVDHTGLFNLDGVGADGMIAEGHVGVDYQMGKMVFGALGEYQWRGGLKSRLAFDGGYGGLGVDLQQDHAIVAALRAGVLASPTTLFYGLVGYEWLTYSGIGDTGNLGWINPVNYGVAPSGHSYSYGDDTLGLVVLGAGIEEAVTSHLTVGIEGRYAFGSKETIYSETLVDSKGATAATSNVTIEPTEWSVMGRVSYHFNGN